MKVEVNEDYEIVFSDVFNAIGIHAKDGEYGICQRDFGIVVMKEGKCVFDSSNPTIEREVIQKVLSTLHKDNKIECNEYQGKDFDLLVERVLDSTAGVGAGITSDKKDPKLWCSKCDWASHNLNYEYCPHCGRNME